MAVLTMEWFRKRKYTRSCYVLLLLAVVPCVFFVLMTKQDYVVGSVLQSNKEKLPSTFYDASQTTKAPIQTIEGSPAKKCEIENNFSNNLKKLENLHIQGAEPWYSKLGFDKPARVIDNSSALPVIVTGSDQKYFKISQGFFKSVHEVLMPKYPDLKLVFYDLGLTRQQHNIVKKYCRCEVRKLDFKEFPPHVKTLKNYAFKPLIVKMLYQEFGYVWWFDTAFRFKFPELDGAFKYQQQHNIWLLDWHICPENAILSRTRKEIFRYFDEEPCNFSQFCEIQGGITSFKTSHVADVMLRLWTSCALVKNCIEPPGSKLGCPQIPQNFTDADIGKCHRFDQSVINIIFRRLFQTNIPQHGVPGWLLLNRGEVIKYFPNA